MRGPIAAILGAYTLLAIGFSVVVPAFNGPDEPYHFAHARYIATHGSLPDQNRPDAFVPGEGHGPPLYYSIAALILRGTTSDFGADLFVPDYAALERFARAPAVSDTLPALNPRYVKWGHGGELNMFLTSDADRFPFFGSFRALHLLRLLSVLLGAVTVFFVARIGTLLAPDRPWVGWMAAGVCAFNPQFGFLHGLVTNDTAAVALATVGLWLVLRLVVAERIDWRAPALAGACAGLGLLTKSNTGFLVPTALGALALRGARESGRAWWRASWRAAAVFGVTVVAIAGWYTLRNVALYGPGDPLGLEVFKEHHPQLVIPEALRGRVFREIFFQRLFTSYWGHFDWLTIQLPAWLYACYGAITACALPGAVSYLRSTRAPRRTAALLLVVGFALVLASVAWLDFGVGLMAAQGRLLWPALAPVCVFAALGLAAVLRDRRGPLAAVVVSLAALDVWVLFAVVYPVYR